MLPKFNIGYIDLGGTAVPFELRRSRRRRTLGLTVTLNQVRIYAPSWTPRAEINHYVQQQQEWLNRAWTRIREKMPAPLKSERTEFSYLGRDLTREFHVSVFSEVRRSGHVLHVHAPAEHDAEALIRGWLYGRASRVLAWRLARLARRLGRAPKRFALSNAQTQWGSCTRSGHIRLNWRLVQAPLTLIDYVAAHELAHLVHLNHSSAFWAQVALLCPEVVSRRTTLRKLGTTLFRI